MSECRHGVGRLSRVGLHAKSHHRTLSTAGVLPAMLAAAEERDLAALSFLPDSEISRRGRHGRLGHAICKVTSSVDDNCVYVRCNLPLMYE